MLVVKIYKSNRKLPNSKINLKSSTTLATRHSIWYNHAIATHDYQPLDTSGTTKMIKKISSILALGCAVLAGYGFLGFGEPDNNSRPIGPDGIPLNRIPGVESIDVPSGLTPKQAIDAVELAIKGTNPGSTTKHWVSQWRIEARDPNDTWIRACLTVRQHSLKVCYRLEGDKIIPDVPSSTNLKQDGIRIHRNVPGWINKMRPLIQEKLYDMEKGIAAAAGTAVTVPASPAPASPVPAPSQDSFCSECGAPLSPNANFCHKCGEKVK